MMKGKKALSLLLTLIMAAAVIPLSAVETFAEEVSAASVGAKSGTTGDCTWRLSEDGVITISGKGAMEDYPSQEPPWFASRFSIHSLIIEDGVTTIGTCAFRGCEYLTNVIIPDSVTQIGDCAFFECESLLSVTIPNSVTSIESGTFYRCESLSNVFIPNSVTRIGSHAFQACYSLQNVTIPDSAILIGEYAFDSCIVKKITISGMVTSIATGAFMDCQCLESVTIPASVTSIEFGAFSNCHSLEDVYYGGSEEQWRKIFIDTDNSWLTNATIHYNSSESAQCLLFHHNGEVIPGITTHIQTNWFYEDNSVYNHKLAQLCAEMVLESYLAEYQNASEKATAIRNAKGNLTKALGGLGFALEDKYIDLDTGRDDMNYFITSKNIRQNDSTCHLIFVACIGSHEQQWNSDFDPESVKSSARYSDTESLRGTNHLGFNDAKNFIYQKLSDYMDDKGFDYNNTKILLTGHSRGAATANLLAAQLIDRRTLVASNNLYTYTFASPNCTNDANRRAEKYGRIFNIVFPNDFVTKVLPSAWGYGRYGVTYSLPTKTNDTRHYTQMKSRMMGYYETINRATQGNSTFHDYLLGEADVYAVTATFSQCVSGMDDFYHTNYLLGLTGWMTPYEYFQEGLCPMVNKSGNKSSATAVMLTPFAGGGVLYRSLSTYFIADQAISSNFADAHKMETYCSFMLALNADKVTTSRKALLGSVNCPVDVEIYDLETGALVGRIVNNTVDEELLRSDNGVVMTVDGDEKQYWLPSDGNYEVRLIGNDDGAMDYSVAEVDSDLGEVGRVNYSELPVTKDMGYTDIFAEYDVIIDKEDIVDPNGDQRAPDEVFSSDDKVTYTVETVIEGSGKTDGKLTVTGGDYVTLSAVTDRSEFLGWYEGDELVCEEADYRFKPIDDTLLTAKFTEKTVICGDADGDGEVTVLDATAIQMQIANMLYAFCYTDASDTDTDGRMTIADATYIQRWVASIQSLDPIGTVIS